MQKIKKIIVEKILEQVKNINAQAELTTDEIVQMLEYPPDSTLGDLAMPCFKPAVSRQRRYSQCFVESP